MKGTAGGIVWDKREKEVPGRFCAFNGKLAITRSCAVRIQAAAAANAILLPIAVLILPSFLAADPAKEGNDTNAGCNDELQNADSAPESAPDSDSESESE
jgi:hypothetical protein